MSSIKEKFGKRLRELRKSKGFTQEQLAELVSIEPPNLSKIECGTHFPQPEKLEKIANALNIQISDLFEFEHIQEKNILVNYIISTLTEFDSKTVELVYKIISDIKLYRK